MRECPKRAVPEPAEGPGKGVQHLFQMLLVEAFRHQNVEGPAQDHRIPLTLAQVAAHQLQHICRGVVQQTVRYKSEDVAYTINRKMSEQSPKLAAIGRKTPRKKTSQETSREIERNSTGRFGGFLGYL